MQTIVESSGEIMRLGKMCGDGVQERADPAIDERHDRNTQCECAVNMVYRI